MSVLIKGAEMPEDCIFCPAFNGTWGRCNVLERATVIAGKHPDCPLIEIPPHGRLIDADAVEKQIDYVANLDWNINVGASGGMLAALEIVEDAPTIIEAEGRK